MNVDKVGRYLEHQGFSDEMIDDFFEHHGVKGQKWGVRRKAKIAGAGLVGGLIGGKASLGSPVGFGLGIVGGALIAKKLLDAHGDKPISELSKG
jgi:hypothetical protein